QTDGADSDRAFSYETARLFASDGAEMDAFGWSVAVSGNTAVIGAVWDDDNGTDSGSAYVFRFDGADWCQQQELLPSDGKEYDWFGCSVDISGDVIVIGAKYTDDQGADSGAAYVFRLDDPDWVEEAKLLASDGAAELWFGYTVAISGDAVLIGAPRDDDCGTWSGSAYVFRFDGSSWFEQQKLLAADGTAYDWFARAVDISGDAAVIGAHWDDDHGSGSGSAYVYRFDGASWVQEQKLLDSEGAPYEWFGRAVAVDGDVAVVGAYRDGTNGLESGSACVYRYDGSAWSQSQKLLASDGAEADFFGYSVAVGGDVIVIGADGDDDAGPFSGSAYLFRFNGSSWSQQRKLLASDGAPADHLGYSVAIAGDLALIGAYGNDDLGEKSGSAYVFDLCPADVNSDGTIDIDDLFALLAAWGPCDGCAEDLNNDGWVDIDDIFEVLAAWGPCP
ncbi:MAG: hypothetical protein JSV91_15355, partial [Phycisphaerales bacterium]